ncbi:MAG: S-adenosyl-l-methionine hydroxide adenosyltransferase family protein [Halolamina sp.]
MITLASDFGTPYPAAMKGAILRRSDARLVDIAHDFPRQDVRAAAFWLRETLPEFPPATHLVVVDPGVGTDRAAIAIAAGDHHIVAPDNGVAVPVARELVGDEETAAFTVYDLAYDEESTSNTFHGRDVFAPAAADLHEAGSAGALERASPTDSWVDLTFPEPRVAADSAAGEVLVVDDFGNSVSNIPGEVLAGHDAITVNGERTPVRRSYAAVEPGERLATVGSHGNVEFAVNQGRGDDAFGLGVGDRVALEW